jgi:hypothetical protein
MRHQPADACRPPPSHECRAAEIAEEQQLRGQRAGNEAAGEAAVAAAAETLGVVRVTVRCRCCLAEPTAGHTSIYAAQFASPAMLCQRKGLLCP